MINLKLSLFCIVMNNAEGLKRMMESHKGTFDEIIIVDTESTDDGATMAVAREYADEVYTFERPIDFPWIDDFAAARNFAMSKCTGDYIMWLDSDDVAVGFGKLRGILGDAINKHNADCLFMKYEYSFDEYGNCTTVQNRERLLKNGKYKWQANVHEVAIPIGAHVPLTLQGDAPYVRHEGCVASSKEDQAKRMDRNLQILERLLEKDGKLETRMGMYLANTYYGSGRFEEAIPYFEEYIKDSTFAEEVYVARTTLSCCYRELQRYDDALRCLQDAVFESPDQPTAYAMAAEVFLRDNSFDKAYHLAKIATECTGDTSHVAFNPMMKQALPAAVLQIACVNLQKFDEAEEWGKKAAAFMRGDSSVARMLEETKRVLSDRRIYEAFKLVSSALNVEGNVAKIEHLRSSVPQRIQDLGDLGVTLIPDVPEGKRHVIIFCGNSVETWGPHSITDGIGGSEEAVINMAYELRDQGCHVEVYGNPPMDIQGEFDGVWWIPFWVYKPERHTDVFIAWRSWSFVKMPKDAGQVHIWLHDKQFVAPSKETVDAVDKVMVVSQYHRGDDGLEDVPEDKIFYTRNGLNQDMLAVLDNDPHEAIYASSPDRGLVALLEMWPDIIAEVPDAVLDIYYGFTKYYDQASESHPHLKVLKEKVLSMVNQQGVQFQGMIGQRELAREFAHSGVWLYPTEFAEVSCITAMKAAAHGCIPVTSNFGVLSETLLCGWDATPFTEKDVDIYTDNDARKKWVSSVVETMLNPPSAEYRQEMAQVFRDKYSWAGVATEWMTLFSEKPSKALLASSTP